MELLRQHGLYGGGLVEIDDPLLVERYNGCLTEIGEKPTSLNRFQIDGRGWSPEIAAEKHNDAYLSHGGAMQYTILLTPEQKGKPIHNAYFSFERALLAFLFDKAGDAIARVTSSTGVWVQLDPGLSEFEQLSDLTMVRSINVTLGDQKHLIEAAEEQRKLVSRFSEEKDAWMDDELRSKIVASGKEFGDLRFAASFQPTYKYTDVVCFYVQQFGGAFVLRLKPEDKELLVVGEDSLADEEGIRSRVVTFKNRTLFSRLLNTKLVEVPIEWYRKNTQVLESLRENLLVSTIYRDGRNKDVNFMKMNPAQRERCIMDCRDELPQEFSALERLEQRLVHGDPIDVSRLSLQLKWLLARPVEGLPTYVAETVWKLICRAAEVRVITQFTYDKETFFKTYGSWPEQRKRWAVETILSSGFIPRRHT